MRKTMPFTIRVQVMPFTTEVEIRATTKEIARRKAIRSAEREVYINSNVFVIPPHQYVAMTGDSELPKIK